MIEPLVYVIVIGTILALTAVLRITAKHYTNSKAALIMLAVEKRLSMWAQEQAETNGAQSMATAQYITDRFYPVLPVWVKIFVSKDQMVAKIGDLYEEMLDYLDDGIINESIRLTRP